MNITKVSCKSDHIEKPNHWTRIPLLRLRWEEEGWRRPRVGVNESQFTLDQNNMVKCKPKSRSHSMDKEQSLLPLVKGGPF